MIYRKNTKELLAESILELSKHKSVDKITIKEITENCGMTSPTFYNHFKDKYELIAWIYLYQAEEMLLDYENGNASWYDAILEAVRMLKANVSFFRNALKNTNGQDSFFMATHIRSIEMTKELLEKRTGASLSKELDFALKFYMRGFGYSVEDWLLNDTPYTEEELADYLCKMVPENLKEYLFL